MNGKGFVAGTICGIAFLLFCAFGTYSILSTTGKKSSVISQDPTPISVRTDKPVAPVVGFDTIDLMLWLLVFLVFDGAVAFWAWCAIRKIQCNRELTPQMKLKHFENEDLLFDLPLYAGLFGTVLGFLLISRGIAVSRDIAYISTVVGILASALMRILILIPERRKLLENCGSVENE